MRKKYFLSSISNHEFSVNSDPDAFADDLVEKLDTLEDIDLLATDSLQTDHCYAASISPPDAGSMPISPASTSPSSYHSSSGDDALDNYGNFDILQQAADEIFRTPKEEDFEICRVSFIWIILKNWRVLKIFKF